MRCFEPVTREGVPGLVAGVLHAQGTGRNGEKKTETPVACALCSVLAM